MYAKVQDVRNLDDDDDGPPIQAKTYDAGMAYYQAYKGFYDQLSTVKDDEQDQFQRDQLLGEGTSTTASTHRKVVGVIEDGGRAAQRSIVGDSETPAGRSFDHSEMEEKKRASRTSSKKFRKQQSSNELSSSSSSAANKAGASRKKE